MQTRFAIPFATALLLQTTSAISIQDHSEMAPAIMQLAELACDTCDQAANTAADGGYVLESQDDDDDGTDSSDFEDSEDSDNDKTTGLAQIM